MSLNRWGTYQGMLGGRKWGTTLGLFGSGTTTSAASGVTSTVWPAANLAIYVPFVLESESLLTQLWALNGTVVAGNIDVGLYTADGVRVVSAGSTAQAGTTVMQKFNVTDTWCAPGLYYLALALSDGATATIGGQTQAAAVLGQVIGAAEQTSAFPLPAAATFATFTRLVIPNCGCVGDAFL